MRIPSATYRIQFHKDFTLQNLADQIEYIKKLGISTIYAAPILSSRPGSMHGYDVIDPLSIDEEIGSVSQLKKLSQTLKDNQIGWLQDIVPNHMAFDVRNHRLMDVLERGPLSPYYNFFDIDWNHPSEELNGKVMVPFLGSPLDECIDNGEIKISFSNNGFTVDYFDTSYPLSVSAIEEIVTKDKALRNWLGEFAENASAISEISKWQSYKEKWGGAINRNFVDDLCSSLNKDKELLRDLLNNQYYTLEFWKTSEKKINYRRFFTVNELICLRVEDQKVFDEYHRLIKSLYDNKIISGVRIDHIDGLYDPASYIEKLRSLLGKDCYIIAEKILEEKEQLPADWKLEGTSGYEFLSYVNQLVTDREGARKLVKFYNSLIPETTPYHRMVFENKKLILENYMAGEWENLVTLFVSLDLLGDYDRERIKQALGVFMLCLPVYRIYPESLPLDGNDRQIFEEAFQRAALNGVDVKPEIEYLKDLFLTKSPVKSAAALKFLKRLMQFTGPLTAKGVEDTTFYVYNPLISHDEVGDAPSTLGISIDSFHSKMTRRLRTTPLSLNATATHDTKRGEDARLRLNILSEIPDIWEKHVREWMAINESLKRQVDGKQIPSINDEYFIYQALLGGYPADAVIDESFYKRFNEYLVKAIREGKINSNWSEPNEAYENGCIEFVKEILDENHLFRASFAPFTQMVSRYANIYALVQVVVKATAPGIPDIYQGAGLWDLSFVDPDNRRPVDYTLRKSMMDQIGEKEKEGTVPFFHFLKIKRSEGYEKLFVTAKVLNFRKDHPDLFLEGDYVPLKTSGINSMVLAYARVLKDHWLLVVLPLALARNSQTDQPYADEYDETRYISLPSGAPEKWTNIFSGFEVTAKDRMPVFEAFKDFPVALFSNK